jgi:hypothetical protein
MRASVWITVDPAGLRGALVVIAALLLGVDAMSVKSADEPKVRGEKFKDAAGREWWRVSTPNAKYEIPDEYVATVGRSGVSINLHWPSARAVRSLPAGTKVDSADLVSVFIAPPPAVAARDSYDAHREAIRRYEGRPSAKYPGLVEYFSVSKKTGVPVFHYYVSGAGEEARTPSGNPYLCSIIDPGETDSVRCDSVIALGDGDSVRIRYAGKHLADWSRIYSETLRLVQSFRKK